MKRVSTALLSLLALITTTTHALEGWRVGWYGALTSNKIDDNAGPTQTPRETTFLNFMALSPADRDRRLLIQAYQYDTKVDAKAGSAEIGQEIERQGVLVSRQWLLRLSRGWKPWIGVGVGYVNESRTGRHTIAPDGFLDRRFSNIDEGGFELTVNTSTEWQLTENIDAGVHLQYQQPFSDTSKVLSGGLTVFYRF